MASEWVEESFPDLIDFQEGPGILARDFRQEGVPLIRLAGLSDRGSVLAGCNYLDPDMVSKKWSHFRLAEGDVLLSTSASLGRVAVVGKDAVGAVPYTGIIRMRPRDHRLLAPFIRYLLQGRDFQRQAQAVGVGSVIRHFGPMHLRRMTVSVPPVDEQRAIAHILGTLDDKIELNRRMSETLEAIARALFKSWFVDFDPVRAKMEGRDPGLPKDIADLFPDRLVESELGEIPEGWEVRLLRDLTGHLSRGMAPAYVETGGICVLNQKCIRDRRVDFSKARRHDAVKKPADGRLLQLLDILVNSTGVGTLGRAAQLWHLPEPTLADSHVTVLRAAPAVDPFFLGIGLTRREDEIEALGEGSTGQTELSRSRLGDLSCIVPSEDLQARFGVTAGQLVERLSSCQRESDGLAKMRDALIPKLISGELRVKDADTFLERTLA